MQSIPKVLKDSIKFVLMYWIPKSFNSPNDKYLRAIPSLSNILNERWSLKVKDGSIEFSINLRESILRIASSKFLHPLKIYCNVLNKLEQSSFSSCSYKSKCVLIANSKHSIWCSLGFLATWLMILSMFYDSKLKISKFSFVDSLLFS